MITNMTQLHRLIISKLGGYYLQEGFPAKQGCLKTRGLNPDVMPWPQKIACCVQPGVVVNRREGVAWLKS